VATPFGAADSSSPITSEGKPRRALLHGRVRGSAVICAGELGADHADIGMLTVVKDGQRLLPGLPGLRRLAGGAAGVAEVGEGER
jgi:hypothetical protein